MSLNITTIAWLLVAGLIITSLQLTGCHASMKRQHYFETGSRYHYQFQQTAGTITHPPEFVVCGSPHYPCVSASPLSKTHFLT